MRGGGITPGAVNLGPTCVLLSVIFTHRQPFLPGKVAADDAHAIDVWEPEPA